MKRTALIVGGSGIIGARLVEHFATRDEWDVIVAARNPGAVTGRERRISVDLLDRADCAAKFGALREVTHLIYTAYQQRSSLAAEVEPNLAMLANVVETLDRVAPQLERITLMQGGKAYGSFVGPYPTPARESDARHMPPNFYFDQEDYLRVRQPERRWSWVALRPGFVGGISFGNPMNITAVIAVYAVISRELGLPLRFPGTPAGYSALHQITDAGLLARAVEWTAVQPQCANEIYNVTNGDYFRWERLFPVFAEHFAMPIAGPSTIRLAEVMADKAPLWAKMVAKYDLAMPDYAKVAAWAFGDAAFHRHWDAVSNVNKLKATGFLDWMDSEAMFLELFREMQRLRIIPR